MILYNCIALYTFISENYIWKPKTHFLREKYLWDGKKYLWYHKRDFQASRRCSLGGITTSPKAPSFPHLAGCSGAIFDRSDCIFKITLQGWVFKPENLLICSGLINILTEVCNLMTSLKYKYYILLLHILFILSGVYICFMF